MQLLLMLLWTNLVDGSPDHFLVASDPIRQEPENRFPLHLRVAPTGGPWALIPANGQTDTGWRQLIDLQVFQDRLVHEADVLPFGMIYIPADEVQGRIAEEVDGGGQAQRRLSGIAIKKIDQRVIVAYAMRHPAVHV